MVCVRRQDVAIVSCIVFIALVATFTGCSSAAIETYPVNGKVEYDGGDFVELKGHTVEFMPDPDPLTLRPYGVINANGTFAMETLYQGEILKGVPEGNYKARIVLSDDDESGKPRAGNPVHQRFLDYETSGFTFKVPGEQVVMKVTKS